ncbi:MAG TPA: hypothetical protein VKU02_09175 [Gemmataceae bacterium]|nr:hypothetical protein [Gemmataceae bacterium]
MNTQVTIEIEAKHEAIVRRAVALAEEMEPLALTAPEGAVFQACEEAVIAQGRTFPAQALSEAVTRRIDAAEKKGRRSASAAAVTSKKTVAPKPVDS